MSTDSAKNLATVKKEESLLGLLIIRPEFISSSALKDKLSEDIFQCEFSKKVWRELLRNEEAKSEGAETFGDAFNPDEMGRITQMTVKRRELSNNSEAVAIELADALRAEADRKNTDDGSDEAFFKRIEELKKIKK